MTEPRFEVRTYGKSELALLYFPRLGKEAAQRRLRHWLRVNPRLRRLVSSKTQYYTPQQVRRIVEEVGEPFDTE